MGGPLSGPSPELASFTDASLEGVHYVEGHTVSRSWNVGQGAPYFNGLEFTAVLLTLQEVLSWLRNRPVHRSFFLR